MFTAISILLVSNIYIDKLIHLLYVSITKSIYSQQATNRLQILNFEKNIPKKMEEKKHSITSELPFDPSGVQPSWGAYLRAP